MINLHWLQFIKHPAHQCPVNACRFKLRIFIQETFYFVILVLFISFTITENLIYSKVLVYILKYFANIKQTWNHDLLLTGVKYN